ncbi:MAG: radical SAM protein, partial [Elusimicrobia bacterium]|nr:radical SAM protein [Elusimicrobiota bacterium]
MILLANPSYTASINSIYERYFIRSGSRWPHSGVKRKKSIPHYLPFPFFLAYAAAVLRERNHSIDILDCVALNMNEQEFIRQIQTRKADFLFFESTTPTIAYDIHLAEKIKKTVPDIRIIMGGPHSTTFAEDIMKQCKSIDFIVRHEYEHVLADLMDILKNQGNCEQTSGITMRANGSIKSTPDAQLIDPLDVLPRPARELFPCPENPNPAMYWDGFCQLRPAIQMHASRGCPYRCDFCLWNQVMYRNGKYRMFSAERIVDEIQDVITKYNAREIYFDDDDFTINKRQVVTLCNEIIRRGLAIRWSCMGDAINLDEEVIALMARSGCIGIKFGVETGSEKIIKNLGKPINLQKIVHIARWCGERGIKTHATFTIGLYGDDMDTIAETLLFMHRLDVDTIQLSICTPFPGTRFFQNADARGLLRTKQWQLYDGKASEIIQHPHINWEQVERVRTT